MNTKNILFAKLKKIQKFFYLQSQQLSLFWQDEIQLQ